MKLLKLVFLAFITLSLISCVESLHPLSAEDSAKYDESIFGIWKDAAKGNIFIHIGKSTKISKANLMTAVQIEHRVDGKIDDISVEMFPSTVNKIHYMNVKPNTLDQKSSGYYFLKYELISPNTLKICAPKYDLFETAAQKAMLLTETSPERLISGSTQTLVDFFRSADVEGVFVECKVFKNIAARGLP